MPVELSKETVRSAYQLILGREPEDEAVLDKHMETLQGVTDLRRRFIASGEFKAKVAQIVGPITSGVPLNAPKTHVAVDADPEELAAMIRFIEHDWTILGTDEPHWSVLTGERFRKQAIGDNIEAFYASGQRSLQTFLTTADRAGVDVSDLKSCFELGCGVGRVTVWLAQKFDKVTAADISVPHLRLALDAAEERSLTNIDFKLLNQIDVIRTLPNFDAFYSVIVLQHNPPPIIAFLLDEILGKLNPGGVAYFQVPTYRLNARFDSAEYLAKPRAGGKMEVHTIPQAKVWEIAERHGCSIMDVREDGAVGSPHFVSNTILVRKKG